MRLVTCLLLALGAGLAGLSLRMLVPVTPVDDVFREVVRLHPPKDKFSKGKLSEDTLPKAEAPASNTPETSAP